MLLRGDGGSRAGGSFGCWSALWPRPSAIWSNDRTGQQIKRSLLAYDH
nr:hypothetical protein [Nonomuraea maritima]